MEERERQTYRMESIMTEKRFFEIDYDEIYYIVDSSRLQKKKTAFEDEEEYQKYCLENSLIGTEVVDLLNSITEENKELKHWKKGIIEYLTDWFNKTEYLSVLYKINEINNEIGLDNDD